MAAAAAAAHAGITIMEFLSKSNIFLLRIYEPFLLFCEFAMKSSMCQKLHQYVYSPPLFAAVREV